MNNSQARVEEIFAEAARLFSSKNATYQDSWRTQGWRGNLSRILEKSGRLRAMLWRGGNVLLNGSNEHPRETCIDMINTLVFLVINMDDAVEWGNESQAKEIRPPVDPLERMRVEYAASVGSHSEELYAEQWPPHLRKETDTPLPAHLRQHPEGTAPATVRIPAVQDSALVAPHLGEAHKSGEDNSFDQEEDRKPSPRKRVGPRVEVTDKGSGPRRVKDTP